MKAKKLKLKKLRVTKISNMRSIMGGIEDRHSIEIDCNLTVKATVDDGQNTQNCETQVCDEGFEFF